MPAYRHMGWAMGWSGRPMLAFRRMGGQVDWSGRPIAVYRHMGWTMGRMDWAIRWCYCVVGDCGWLGLQSIEET